MRASLVSIGLIVGLCACVAPLPPPEEVVHPPAVGPQPAAQPAPQAQPPVPVPAPGSAPNGQMRILLGLGQLDEDQWAPTEDPIVFGAEFAFMPPGAWLGFEFGARFAGDYDESHGVDLGLWISELYFGPTAIFRRDERLQPYVGAGLSLVAVFGESELNYWVIDDDDTTFGFYAHAGLAYRFDQVLIGFDARLLTGTDVELFGYSGDVDGMQYCAFMGLGQ